MPPSDPLLGFLPPNVNAPEGQGYVTFAVMGLQFALPPGVLPGHVRAFRVRWILRGAGGETYVQHTSFRQPPRRRSVYHYPWFYHAGWYSYCYRW